VIGAACKESPKAEQAATNAAIRREVFIDFRLVNAGWFKEIGRPNLLNRSSCSINYGASVNNGVYILLKEFLLVSIVIVKSNRSKFL
jgi:hypothetical protein